MLHTLRHMGMALVFLAVAAAPHVAMAQAPAPPPPYGPAITFDQAQKVMVAAQAEARKNNWNVVIAVVDSGGHLTMRQRFDNTSHASIDVAKGKAVTAVNFRRPSKALEDVIAGGGLGLRLLRIDGLTPVEGGIPIVLDGKIIGGIGVSGVTSAQDAQIARAGADALK